MIQKIGIGIPIRNMIQCPCLIERMPRNRKSRTYTTLKTPMPPPEIASSDMESAQRRSVEDFRLGGRELLIGEDAGLVQLTEFLEFLHRILLRRRRSCGHLLFLLSCHLLFFLARPPALLAMAPTAATRATRRSSGMLVSLSLPG